MSAAGTVPVFLIYRLSTTAMMTVTMAIMTMLRVIVFFIKNQMLLLT